jgi:hypothetical protein
MGEPAVCKEVAQRCTELNRTVGPTLTICSIDLRHRRSLDPLSFWSSSNSKVSARRRLSRRACRIPVLIDFN